MELLKKLCSMHAPSGNESGMTRFLLEYIQENKSGWQTQPILYEGGEFQDCIILSFGKPRTAIFAHMDNIGFTVRYNNQLVRIGSPNIKDGIVLQGTDSIGPAECTLFSGENNSIYYKSDRELDRGTDLSFKPIWKEDAESVQCCYMDNRLGVWVALKLCESLENGLIVFSCREEHGGGTVPFLSRFLHEKFLIRQALICDITWITEGVFPGKGVVISMRDSGIPRHSYVSKIISHASASGIPYQREVEGSGGSDGTELQKQPYPIDWCFIGAGEEFVHSPEEKVRKTDIDSMLSMYRYLMTAL